MNFSGLFRFYTRPALLAVLSTLAAGEAWAQARAQSTARPTTAARPAATTAARPTAAGGGTGGGGGGAANARQYPNTTMVGEAMITSDVETRRLIIVTDDATNDNIRSIIQDLDKPKPQVLINVVFLQVTHDKDLDLGAEASYTGRVAIKTNPLGLASTKFGVNDQLNDPTSYGAFYRLLGRDVTATIHALSSMNKTEILSRPSILTRSNQQATIMVGQSVPIITNSRVSDTTNTTINTVQYQDIGIILRVTPFITSDGLVEMIVAPEISSLSATTVPISNTVSSPVIDKRSADTVIVTKSDKTVVIGGLIANERTGKDSKVPILGDIPIIGNAFKRTASSNTKTELLIFLTPHVINTPDELGTLTTSEREKLELAPKAFEKADIGKFLPASKS
jgi:general secretion pathway protein D